MAQQCLNYYMLLDIHRDKTDDLYLRYCIKIHSNKIKKNWLYRQYCPSIIQHTHVDAGIYHKKSITGRPELEVKILTVATYLVETDEQMRVGDLIGKKAKNVYMILNNRGL